MKADYSLYLVTDSRKQILGDRDLVSVVEAALKGGVTIVQYRDKSSDTAQLIETASKLHEVTKKHGVPLIINDRMDVALAVGAEGIHLGQGDIDVATARGNMGPLSIVGKTVCSPEEVHEALKEKVDYLGIGTVFSTPTKDDTKAIIGTAGLRSILETVPNRLPTVCIGGINSSNVQRVMYQSATQHGNHALSGVAIVSAIMAASDSAAAARNLRQLVTSNPPFAPKTSTPGRPPTLNDLTQQTPATLAHLATRKPLCHNMTNLVVTNFAANVALAIGGSPIMSSNGDEAGDLAALKGSLVLNMGTSNADALRNYSKALAAYNAVGAPVLLDPVGGGATAVRRAAVRQMLGNGYFDVMKGNEAEIRTLFNIGKGPFQENAGGEVKQHGVDSSAGGASLSDMDKAQLVRDLAARERNVTLMTGETDYISDGRRVFAVKNGHEFLGGITGSGCTLGTTVAAFAAIARQQQRASSPGEGWTVPEGMLGAVLMGVLSFEIAAQLAVEKEMVKGPGTFIPAFIDSLFDLRQRSTKGDHEWIRKAKVEEINK